MKEFKLTDLEGIGPKKAEALEGYGIKTPLDFIIRGAKEISRLTGLTTPASLKHIHNLQKKLAESGEPIKINSIETLRELRKTVTKIPTNCKELDLMTRGGFETQAVYEIYGPEAVGKTQLTFTLTAEALRKKQGVWFIDCEGTFDEQRLEEICNKRLVTYNPEFIQYDLITDSEELRHIINSDALEKIKTHDINLIIIDGLVGLFRFLYHGRGELYERQDIIEEILIKLKNLSIYLNVCVILTNQVQSNPDPWGEKEKPVGGHVFGHSVKYIYALKKGMKNNRIARVIKSNKDPMADFVFYLTAQGVANDEK